MFFEEEDAQCDVVPLITCQDGRYEVDEGTMRWLGEHKDGSLVIVSCAGRYRTGKSFLLNRLAGAQSMHGFSVGNSVQACTKGLWVYKKFFKTPDPSKHMLLVDTEGIDALDAEDTHDVRIFTLALLLSTAFMYNSVGAIDETAMQTLSLMTRVTESVRMSADDEDSPSTLSEAMPDFYWLLRDFSLQLTDREGKTITAGEYLENALYTKDPLKDQVRAAIRGAFPSRALLTLPRPTGDDGAASQLESRLGSVTAKFSKEVVRLRARLESGRPFLVQGKPVSGNMYGKLCRHYAQIVQTDAVPVIRDSWSLMAEVQARDLRDETLAKMAAAASALAPRSRPVIADELEKLRASHMAHFLDKVMPPVPEGVAQELQAKMAALVASETDRLSKDLAQEVADVLEGLEDDLVASPSKFTLSLEGAEEAFLARNDQDEAARRAWKAVVSQRAMRWLVRVVQTTTTRIEALVSEVDVSHERIALMESQIHEAGQTASQECRVEIGQLQQQIASKSDEISELNQRMLALQAEMVEAEQAFRRRELELRDELSGPETTQPLVKQDENEDDREAVALEVARIKDRLREEVEAHGHATRKIVELEGRLHNANLIHEKLRTSWTTGLAELRQQAERRQLEYEEASRRADEAADRLRRDLEEERAAKESLEERVQSITRSNEAASEVHETEKHQLRDAATRFRQQCEDAQARVLDIHKSMLETLRERDERARDEQCVHVRERCEQSTKIQQLTHEVERLNETVSSMKRRCLEADTIGRECKRLRAQHQENALALGRAESENEQLKQQMQRTLAERDGFREANQVMEGELALARAKVDMAEAMRQIGE